MESVTCDFLWADLDIIHRSVRVERFVNEASGQFVVDGSVYIPLMIFTTSTRFSTRASFTTERVPAVMKSSQSASDPIFPLSPYFSSLQRWLLSDRQWLTLMKMHDITWKSRSRLGVLQTESLIDSRSLLPSDPHLKMEKYLFFISSLYCFKEKIHETARMHRCS